VPVEVKLSVLSERDLIGQVNRYLCTEEFRPEKGTHLHQRFEASKHGICLVVDQLGVYLVAERGFIKGQPGEPALFRERLNADLIDSLRALMTEPFNS
jgi:hypothetical protein